MALTRKMLKAMGIEEEKIEQIIEAHTESTDSLKERLAAAEEAAQKNDKAAKELEEIKANPGDDFQAKYEAEHTAFEEFKKQKEQEEATATVQGLFRAQLEELGITGKRASQIIKATDTSAFKVKDGEFEDAEAVKKAIADDWGEFVPKTTTEGAKVPTPPANSGTAITKEQFQKMSYKERSELYQNDIETYNKLSKE